MRDCPLFTIPSTYTHRAWSIYARTVLLMHTYIALLLRNAAHVRCIPKLLQTVYYTDTYQNDSGACPDECPPSSRAFYYLSENRNTHYVPMYTDAVVRKHSLRCALFKNRASKAVSLLWIAFFHLAWLHTVCQEE